LLGESEGAPRTAQQRARDRAALRASWDQELVLQLAPAEEDATWQAICQAACGEAAQHESRYQELFVRLAARNETAADQPLASA